MAEIKEMFPHIAGYNNIKKEGKQIIDILSNPQNFISKGSYIPRGWFLYGDPGMGKTRFVKDIAEYLDYNIIEISSSEAIRRNLSTNEMLVTGFDEAIEQKRCIIFLDELDRLCGYDRFDYAVSDNLENQKILLHKLDEIKNMNGIVVFATANHEEYLDESVLRSGRFDRHIHFPDPTASDREELVNYFLGGVPVADDISLNDIVKTTCGSSCAEIESIINESKILMISNHLDSIDYESFNLAYNRITREDIAEENPETGDKLKYVAYHEAGHCVAAYLLKPEAIREVTLYHQGEGVAQLSLDSEDGCVYTQEDIEKLIKIAFAGYVTVPMMTGTYTYGCEGDLDKGIGLINSMMDSGFFGVSYSVCRRSENSQFKYDKMTIELTEKYCDQTKELLESHKDMIEKLAQELVKKKKLSKKEIFEIFKN